MRLRTLCTSLALLLFCASASAQAPKPGSLSYRGKVYDAASLPSELGPVVRTAVESWAPWATKSGYRMDLDPTRRVLLLSAKGDVDAAMGLVVKTLALFDSLFPAAITPGPGTAPGAPVAPVAKAAKPKPGEQPDDVIPEDPESPPPGAPKTLAPSKDEPVTVAAAVTFRPDAQTAVMLIAKNSADYESALAHLAAAHPYLAEWKTEAAGQIGFALGNPLCGSYNENSPGQEEWNPDNELVHRTMALLVLRRFENQPYWLHTGLCWHAEMSVCKSIYCMPYRDGFVSTGEHGGWIATLNSLFSGREKQPLRVDELAIVRGTWDDKRSKAALGMVDFLARLNPRALSGFMEELRQTRELNSRINNADGTWTRNTKYEVANDTQKQLLEKYFGAKVMSEVIAYWTTGAITPVK